MGKNQWANNTLPHLLMILLALPLHPQVLFTHPKVCIFINLQARTPEKRHLTW